mgnify:CR=1 FL=1
MQYALKYYEKFTFQYVSINTHAQRTGQSTAEYLHSNMFLLIPDQSASSTRYRRTLHSNMFLLILKKDMTIRKASAFTFQYVSINTDSRGMMIRDDYPLHSNMFLLILDTNDVNTARKVLYIPICFY